MRMGRVLRDQQVGNRDHQFSACERLLQGDALTNTVCRPLRDAVARNVYDSHRSKPFPRAVGELPAVGSLSQAYVGDYGA